MDRLAEILQEAGSDITVQKAISLDEAVMVLKKKKPDMVLLDIDLPENESFMLLREIRYTSPGTGIVMMYTLKDIRTQQYCQLLGADYFIDKYNDFMKIPAALHTVAAQKKGGK
jgi:DNA-binding NarL/FixJ family response regulator